MSKKTPVISSVVSAEPARVQAKAEFDLEIQNIDLAEFKFIEGSRTKIDKSLDLTFLKYFLCLSVYISVRLELRSFEQSLRRDGRS